MSENKQVDFNGYKVELRKIKLRDANILFPYVATAMTKIAFNNYSFFSDLSSKDFELFQEKICENSLKLTEVKEEDGTLVTVKKNLTLSDLNENVSEFLPLLSYFLEFNFGFFSTAMRMVKPFYERVSEIAEKQKKK